VINKANRQHLEQQKAFRTYHEVDKALGNQIIMLLPAIYIRNVKHQTTGYGNVTCLTILTHLWKNYPTITQPELRKDNEKCMQQPWNPPMPTIKVLFTQLDKGVAFAKASGKDFSNTHVVRTGYEIIAANGLFNTACREWRQKPQIGKNHGHFSGAFLTRRLRPPRHVYYRYCGVPWGGQSSQS
jgi:hypothetical protein